MRFGATLLAHPPASRLVELALRAEQAGFDYIFLNEAQTLYQDPWPVFALIADATSRIRIGPTVTSPGLRDPAVTAALLATLDELSEGRMVCGFGRGDASARTMGRRPASPAAYAEMIKTVRALVAGRGVDYQGTDVRLGWRSGSELEIWGAAYGPRTVEAVATECDGLITQAADPAFFDWLRPSFEGALQSAGRDVSEVARMVAAPAYVTEDVTHGYEQVQWFTAAVTNHVSRLAALYADELPASLLELLRVRADYGADTDGPHGAPAAWVTPDLTERLALVGSAGTHIARIEELAESGVSVVNIYLEHDAPVETIDAYGGEIIPVFREE